MVAHAAHAGNPLRGHPERVKFRGCAEQSPEMHDAIAYVAVVLAPALSRQLGDELPPDLAVGDMRRCRSGFDRGERPHKIDPTDDADELSVLDDRNAFDTVPFKEVHNLRKRGGRGGSDHVALHDVGGF